MPRPEPIKFARFPHVANDGTLAFTYQDDVWLADPERFGLDRAAGTPVPTEEVDD